MKLRFKTTKKHELYGIKTNTAMKAYEKITRLISCFDEVSISENFRKSAAGCVIGGDR